MGLKKLTLYSVCSIFLISSPIISNAQQIPVKDLMSEYLNLLQVNGQIPIDGGASVQVDDFHHLDSLRAHPWSDREAPVFQPYVSGRFKIAPYDVRLKNYWQSLEPFQTADGPIWQGRGFTNSISGGVYLRYGMISASVRPTLTFNQNRSFALSPIEVPNGRSEYAYPLGNLDWPQRYGNDSFWKLFAGQSYIRADYSGWATGLSNESMCWSPARQNALLLSNNAPGFPHFFVGTTRLKILVSVTCKPSCFGGNCRSQTISIAILTTMSGTSPVGVSCSLQNLFPGLSSA